MSTDTDPRWKHDGVRVVPGDQLDANTAQTPGMDRQGGDQLRAGRGAEAVGGHGAHPPRMPRRGRITMGRWRA